MTIPSLEEIEAQQAARQQMFCDAVDEAKRNFTLAVEELEAGGATEDVANAAEKLVVEIIYRSFNNGLPAR